MTAYIEFIDITGANAARAPLVKGGLRAYYATGTDGIEETAAQIAAAKAAGMGVVLIDQTPSLSVFAAGLAHVADIENYAGTITSAVAAVKTREAHGLASTLYISYDSLVDLVSALQNAGVSMAMAWFWVADYSWSLAEAQALLTQNANWAAIQYGDNLSNPGTLVPGTNVTLAQAQADIDVAKAAWAAQFLAPAPGPIPPYQPQWTEFDMSKIAVLSTGAADTPGGGFWSVHRLQVLLNMTGDLSGITAAKASVMGTPDGAFGPLTEAAVRAVQAHYGITVDGIAGAQTWSVLLTGSAS